MNNLSQYIKSYKKVYPQLYSYILPTIVNNEGSQKIGYTERKNVHDRIKQQVETAAIKLKYDLLWSAPAFFEDGKKSFLDKTFHKFLEKKGIERKWDLGQEWFYFNGEPFKSKDLFDLFRKEKFSALQNDSKKAEYTLRFEQQEAVKKALAYFEKNKNGEFLWNAKPRFGKTLASYDLAKQLKATKVLIVTNRPAIANSWFDDYQLFIDGYAFISETSSLYNKSTISREQHIATKPIKPQFTFLSLQDLKGSKYFGGYYDKLRWVADLEWDLLIIDEAHEGIDTGRTNAAFDMVKRKNTLHLSGTPFKALANEKFAKDAIYNWTYLDEQKIKELEIEEGEAGAHIDMPDLKLFTYRISQMITDEVNQGIEIENETFDYAFDLNEFFKAKDKKFVRENEVKQFLSNLTTNLKYPFSTPELRAELKHTFWYVGNRVDSVKALEQLLKKDPIFKDYEVIVAAGDGKTFEEEENDFRGNESSFKKVNDAIDKYDKTITLSCGQLTTGVTVKEWTAVLMLTDIKTPSLYMQAAFRAQNPFKKIIDGELYVKKSAYLFDFAPTRVLEIYDQFANGLNPKAVKGEITEKDRKANIHELLNFFPVISEDVNGQMVELDAEKVLTFPNALAATEIVNARFMSNLLFNDSLKGVFNFPKEVEDILNKMPEEKNKRAQQTKSTLDLDNARKVNDDKIVKINENTAIILGEKIFKINTERVVDNLLAQNSDLIATNELLESFSQVAEPLIAKIKEVYKSTQAETNALNAQLQEKVKIVADEYNNSEIKNSDALKQKLIAILEDDFVKNKVVEKEQEIVDKVQKTKEDEIRDRLRSFTRTIPMFIMANASKGEITIDNFDLEITEQDFEDLTSITKAEFHKLRDGFEYDDAGVRHTFHGVFNKYRFNASIAEFKLKKDQLANYFTAEADIFELIPNQKTNQIFTPKAVVQMMVNNLEAHDPSLFTRTDSTFIDLYMKSGMYITEIVKKLFANTRKHYSSDAACLKHILENQVFGLAPTPILQGITQAYIFGFNSPPFEGCPTGGVASSSGGVDFNLTNNNISNKNFIQHDLTPEAQQGTAAEKLQQLFKLKKDMKFDAVVGNPPYQDTGGSGGNNDAPIFQYFCGMASKITSKYVSLIIPSRWFSAGRENLLGDFRKEMLNNGRIQKLVVFSDSSQLFANVEIKGGVCYYLENNNYKGLCKYTLHHEGKIQESDIILNKFDILIREPKLSIIVEKVDSTRKKYNLKTVDSIISSDTPFGIPSNPKDSRKTPFNVYSNSSVEHNTLLYHIEKGVRKIEYVKLTDIIKNNKDVNKYKVFVTGAGGSGNDSKVIGDPEFAPINSVCSQSYLYSSFDTKIEAINFIKYINTRFFRALVSAIKITQSAPSRVYKFVPLEKLINNSDIDWSKSIPEIDQQLYQKYGLSAEEIGFIEAKVKPMG